MHGCETPLTSLLPVLDGREGWAARRAAAWVMIAAAAGILTAAVWNVEPLLSANDRSRWCTVWSLVERGTFVIDEIDARPGWTTIDKVRHNEHFYSSKPPLLSTLYAGIYWLVKQATGWTLLGDTGRVARAVLFVAHVVPWIAALWIVGRIAERFVRTDVARLLLVATAAFGTLVTTFSVSLNNHSVAATSTIFAIYSTLRVLEIARNGEPESGAPARETRWMWIHGALAGFFAALTCACESPAGLFGLALFGLLLRASPRVALFAFGPAAVIPLAAYFGTNWLATGSLKPFQASYGSAIYRYVHEGIPSYWLEPKELDRNVDSPPVYLLHCTFGHHGILSLTPIWLLSLGGWLSLKDRDKSPLRPFLWIGLVLTVAVLGFYLTRTQNYNYGGNCAGLRWTVWLTPFWLLAIVPVAERWGGCWRFRTFACLLLAGSAFSAHVALSNPWKQPWLFGVMRNAGWLRQYDPDPPPPFARPVTTWIASIPEAKPGEESPWVEFEGTDIEGAPIVWRLALDSPSRDEPPNDIATIRFTETTAGVRTIERTLYVDRKAFDRGAPPSEVLRWPGDPPDAREKLESVSFLRGLSADAAYRPGIIRYLKTPARTDAFRCQRAAAWVRLLGLDGDRTVWQRADLWRCDDIPFGIAQLGTTITADATGATLSQRRMTVRGSSNFDTSSMSPNAEFPP